MSLVASRDLQVPWVTDLFIDGEPVPGEGSTFEVSDPSTERTLAVVGAASERQIDLAVRSARAALGRPEWSDASYRRSVLLIMADLIESNAELLTAAVVSEVGTPISLARALHIAEPVALLRKFAELTELDRTVDLGLSDDPPSRAILRQVPSGVVAAVAAYNYPLLFACVKVGAAVAAGCTVVLLSSPLAPLSILLLGRLLQDAGLPPGVVQFVAGGAETGRALTEHPEVDKVSFTGSVPVGRQIMAQAARGLKRIALELGGKSPSILLPSADLPALVDQVHARYLRNAGQGCSSPTRILVPEQRYEEFIELSQASLAGIKTGDPWEPDTVAGPLITAAHRDRVEAYVQRAVAAGGRVAAGGGRPDLTPGHYMNPTLFGGIDNSAEIAQQELFGPVGVVLGYRDVDHAIAIANDSQFGLSATVYGEQSEALRVAPLLRVGTVMINGWLPRKDRSAGGFKNSGMGREVGEGGIREFLETQFIAWPAS